MRNKTAFLVRFQPSFILKQSYFYLLSTAGWRRLLSRIPCVTGDLFEHMKKLASPLCRHVSVFLYLEGKIQVVFQ